MWHTIITSTCDRKCVSVFKWNHRVRCKLTQRSKLFFINIGRLSFISWKFKVVASVSLHWLASCTEGELISPSWLSDVIFTDSWPCVCHRVFSVTSAWVYSVFMCMLCVLRLELTYVSLLSFGECEAMSLWVVWCFLVWACVYVCHCIYMPFGHSLCMFYSILTTLKGTGWANCHQHHCPSSSP